MSYPSLPPNVHISTHPCLQAKLSQLRASTANARETKALVHEISLIIGCEATAAGLTTKTGDTVRPILIPGVPIVFR
jgi:uracil phosphoribosyltransferase